jgi:hypothetical protein
MSIVHARARFAGRRACDPGKTLSEAENLTLISLAPACLQRIDACPFFGLFCGNRSLTMVLFFLPEGSTSSPSATIAV